MRWDSPHEVGRPTSCRECVHFEDDPLRLEQLWPAILIVSSTYGAARGESGICAVRDTFQTPEASCDEFVPRGGRNDRVASGVTGW